MSVPLLSIYGTSGGDFHVEEFGLPCADPMHWWHGSSAWWSFMRGLGFAELRRDREFCWSGEVDGLSGLWRIFKPWTWGRKKDPVHRVWYSAGYGILNYADPYDDNENFFVAVGHSHGGQALLYAAALGLRIPLLITVATPHRADMERVTRKALPNINRWIHVCDQDSDRIGLAGQFGDGSVSVNRQQPLAHVNVRLRAIDHSMLLRDPSRFHLWADTIFPCSPALVANLVGVSRQAPTTVVPAG